MNADPSPDKAIFLEAVERHAPDQWPAFLDRACAGQLDLRSRVEALLEAHREIATAQHRELPEAADPGPVATVDEPPRREQPGAVIGPYKLIEPIGEGGMGTVWMARQAAPVKRLVAVKLIKAGMDSKQVIARFEAERQALALMDHPNIARVLDAGATPEGRPYFAMELVKGIPITRYCDERRLSVRERLELFVPVCQAVQHAHQKGVIHRDLKPSNVLVAPYDGIPVVKVIDFGVAKATGQPLTEQTLATGFGAVVGTLEYMSPEQAELNNLDIDTRSDIYALGVLLYELLTGTTPLPKERLSEAAFAEVLRIIREEEPPRPSTRLSTTEELPSIAANRGAEPAKLRGMMRGELDWIVMKALEKDRSRRYETANGFAMDVQRYLADEPVLACPPSVAYRLRKFAQRNKAALVMASVLAGALVLAVVGLLVSNLLVARERDQKTQALIDKEQALTNERAALAKAREQEGLAKERAEEAKEQQSIAREQELLARSRFRAAQTNLAQQALEAGQPARALDLLESLRPRLDEEDLRGFEWYYLWRLCHPNLRRSLCGPAGLRVWALAITPDGKTLVTGSEDAGVRVWDVAAAKERAVLSGHKARIWRVAVSPDGHLAASAGMDRMLKLWDLGRGELLATFVARNMVRSVAFSPDGVVLAAGTEDGDLEFWDVATREHRLRLQAHPAPAVVLAYSPDGKLLATGAGWGTSRGKGSVKVWDVTSGPPRPVLQLPVGIFAAFSPDSKLLATCHLRGATVWAMPSGERKATLAPVGTRYESVAFAPDGKTVALGGYDRAITLWQFADGATRTAGVHLGPVTTVAFFPGGDLLASGSADGTVKLWHAGPPRDDIRFTLKGAIRSLTFTPDNKRLIIGSDRTTSVLDAATGTETATLPVSGVLAASADAKLLVAWAPDHKRVIWDVAAARPRAVLPVGSDLGGAAFSRDGKTLVTWVGYASTTPERGLPLWDLETSRVRLTLGLVGFGVVRCAAFSPDGKTLAAARQGGQVLLWDCTTGRQRMTLQSYEEFPDDAVAVTFSHDGKRLASGNSGGILRLWDVEGGRLKMTFKGHTDQIHSVAFSPDDKALLSGGGEHTVRLWDVATGQELLTLEGHKASVHIVAFAPDGKRLATASRDEAAGRLWLAATEPEATASRLELDANDSDGPRAMNNWGDRLREMHRFREADNAYGKALARVEKLAAAHPDLLDYQQELAYSLIALAGSLSTDQDQTAEQYHRRAREAYAKLSPDRRLALANRHNSVSWRLAMDPDPALRAPRLSVELAREAVELFPPGGDWRNTLGVALYRAARWKESVATLEKSMELRNGGNSSDWFFLAMAHWQLGEKDKARAWYDRAVQWMDQNLPTNEELRRFRAEAAGLLGLPDPERASELFEQARSLPDPGRASELFEQARSLRDQKKYAEAESILQQVLEAQRKVLGEQHPETLVSLSELAEVYSEQRQFAKAEPLYLRSLEAMRKVFGEQQPQTLATVNALAWLYQREEKYDKAEPLRVQVLDGWREIYGEWHPKTIDALQSLARVYASQGKYTEAETTCRTLLATQRTVLGEEHADVARTLVRLAESLRSQGKIAEAESVFREALAVQRKALGPAHADVASTLHRLAGLARTQKRFPEAEQLYREALAIRREEPGEEHRHGADVLYDLASLLRSQERYGEAEPLTRECLDIRQRTLPEGDWQIAVAKSSLGAALSGQGKYQEAEPLLLAAYKELQVEPPTPAQEVRTREALQRIVQLYEDWGKKEETAQWRAQLPGQ